MIDELEELRKKVKKEIRIIKINLTFIFIMSPIIILLIALSIFSEITYAPIILLYSFLIIFITIPVLIITFISVSSDSKKYTYIYKQNLVLPICKNMFENVEFDMDRGISAEKIKTLNMINTGDIIHSNDDITGKYKNIEFEMSDIRIEKEYIDSDGHTTHESIFDGQWYIFEFNKPFKSKIQVCEKNFFNAERNFLFKKIELEDIEFNKIFKVYAENELECFYVLTPNTIEKIKELNCKIKGNLLLCFIDNKLHIALQNNKDFFEPNINKKMNLEEQQAIIKEQLRVITNFIDILSLDNDLYKD